MVQPVLAELELDVEEAAASLGASRITTFRQIVLPSLVPAIAAGAALSFARGVSEYGSLVLLSGNLPFQTEVTSVRILSSVENDNLPGAAAVATVLRSEEHTPELQSLMRISYAVFCLKKQKKSREDN